MEKLEIRSHVLLDPNVLSNYRIIPLKEAIISSDTDHYPDISFVHKYFFESKCIVDNGIVGLVGKWLDFLAGRYLENLPSDQKPTARNFGEYQFDGGADPGYNVPERPLCTRELEENTDVAKAWI